MTLIMIIVTKTKVLFFSFFRNISAFYVLIFLSLVMVMSIYIYIYDQPRGLLVMRSRVRFPVLPWGFFLEGQDSHGDHDLGSLVELGFKAPPGTSYITIHLIGTT
jgi:hypothetical protein